MKGLISGIKRMEIHDGDGIRTTVFFKGCPLKCIWCHNPESISFKKQLAFYENQCIGCGACERACPYGIPRDEIANSKQCIHCYECSKICPTGAITLYGEEYTVDELVRLLIQDKVFYKKSNGGVTLSGGECLAQADFAVELAKKLFENGVSVYVDTCGFVEREVLEKIIPYTEKFLYDIKAVDPQIHKSLTGKDNKIILDNLMFLVETGCNIEIRYPFVKGYNDGEYVKIIDLMERMNAKINVKVLKYHCLAKSRYIALGMEDTMPDIKVSDKDVEEISRLVNK